MKKVLILFMIINAVLIGMVGYTQYKYSQLQDAVVMAGIRGNTDDAVLSSVFDATNGAIQGIVTGRGTTSLQTTAYTSDAVLSSVFDSTNGAVQLILSDNSSDIIFTSYSGIVDGDLLQYDTGDSVWKNNLYSGEPIRPTYGIVMPHKTADPCTGAGFTEGTMFYNSTANILCYCSASNADLKVSDDSACF